MSASGQENELPFSFRENDISQLVDYITHRHSVELVGMKRVGINNLLRFFLFQKDLQKKYQLPQKNHLLIYVDLNDLIECELFSFWRLTLKRICDSASFSNTINTIFLKAIQSNDLFLTFDGVKDALVSLINQKYLPTIFFTRFDRIKDAVSLEFLNNLQSLLEATNNNLSYVFTSYRELSELAPNVFDAKIISSFSSPLYIKPLIKDDAEKVLEKSLEKYNLSLSSSQKNQVLSLSDGHMQYIHLTTILLREYTKQNMPFFAAVEKIFQDERIAFVSEEIWESLKLAEMQLLQKTIKKENISKEDMLSSRYIYKTGIVSNNNKIFNEFFAKFLQKRESQEKDSEFTKKEFMLFELLKKHINDICEREEIVANVWPEYKEYGVSDWSVDRLIARVRAKLKLQNNSYKITTIHTRGYKLTISE